MKKQCQYLHVKKMRELEQNIVANAFVHLMIMVSSLMQADGKHFLS